MMRTELPTDASSLICIAKCDAFVEIAPCVETMLVPPSVWAEAVEAGERIGAAEVSEIRAAEAAGSVRRIGLDAQQTRLARALANSERLGKGESEVLALGRQDGRCIVDEGRASRVAASMGIAAVPTLLLPVIGYREGRMDLAEAFGLVRRLAVVAGARAEVVFAIEQALKGGTG